MDNLFPGQMELKDFWKAEATGGDFTVDSMLAGAQQYVLHIASSVSLRL